MVSSVLLQNMINPKVADPGKAYREGAGDALAKRILEDKKQQAIESHASNLESAEVGRDSTRTSTKKMIQDLAHDKSERQIKDTFVSLDAASGLPMADQDIYLDNLIEEYDGHGRLGTVLKYMKTTQDPKARAKLFGELSDVGVKGGYLDELYSAKYGGGRSSNLQSYLESVEQAYKDNNNGKSPPAELMVQATERFQKVSGEQAFDRAYGTSQGKKGSDLSTEGTQLRNIEVEHEGNVAEAKKAGAMQAEIDNIDALLTAKGEITPMQQKVSGMKKLNIVTNRMVDYFDELDKKGGIINVDKSSAHNIGVKARTSNLAQSAAGSIGEEIQSIRQSIQNAKPLLLQSIRQSTGMSARGMDSDKELQFYLASVGDETKDLQSNLAALSLLDELYGTGEIAAKLANRVSSRDEKDIEKQKEDFMKEYDKKRQEYIDNTPKEKIDQYYNMQPTDDITQDDIDDDFKELYHFLPEER